MRNSMKVLIAGCVTGFALGATVHGPWDAEAKSGGVVISDRTPEQRCTDTLVAHDWRAGDLCDTLDPAADVTERQWKRYNRANGWEWVGRDCWNTRSTTDDAYVLCWDGTIMRTP